MANDSEGWRDRLITAADLRDGHGRQRLRAASSSDLVRVRRGVYLDSETWEQADADDRHLWRIRAAARAAPTPPVFSHLSAARIWELPLVGAWPERPEVVVTPNQHHSDLVVAHRVRSLGAIEHRAGLRTTALARTVVDVARTAPFSTALAIADGALADRRAQRGLPLATQGQLAAELESLPPRARGRRMAGSVLAIADGASGSAGESLSRCGMHLLGCPPPALQTAFVDDDGLIGYVDFFWPQFRLIGEFDGLGKYLREPWRDGRSPGQVVVDEKVREDRLRALGLGVTRWGWSTARSLPRLRTHLLRAGLPLA